MAIENMTKTGAPLQSIDLPTLLESVQSLPIESRAKSLMLAMGCEAWEGCDRLIKGPSARLAAIGGLPISALMAAGLDAEKIAALCRQSAGAAASMSYLSLPGGSAQSAYGKIAIGMGHGSCLHAVHVSVALAGISTAAENELNSQRDLIHLARLTESRTKAQSIPVLSCLDEAMIPQAQQALDQFDLLRGQALDESRMDAKDALESANNLAPAMRAGIVVASATLRSFQKLFDAISDPGKELEYRLALISMKEQLGQLWPELFVKDPWSQHFAKPKVFEGWMDRLDIAGLESLEVGAGRGALTQALLEKGALSVEAWEIDPEIEPLDDPRVDWRVGDFSAALDEVKVEGKLLAAFPPYGLLPDLIKLSRRAKAALLMAPGRMLPELSAEGFVVLACLPGDAFEPVSKGAHFIVSKGIAVK